MLVSKISVYPNNFCLSLRLVASNIIFKIKNYQQSDLNDTQMRSLTRHRFLGKDENPSFVNLRSGYKYLTIFEHLVLSHL